MMTMQQKGGWFRGTIDTNGVHRSYRSDNDVNDIPNEEGWIQVEEHYIERLRAERGHTTYWLEDDEWHTLKRAV